MKIGVCVNMLGGDPVRDMPEYLSVLEQNGFDYIELPCSAVSALTEHDFKAKVIDVLKSSSLPCIGFNSFLPGDVAFTGPDKDNARIAEYVERSCDRAAAAGASNIGIGSGMQRSVPPGMSYEDGLAQFEDSLQTAANIAAQYDICLMIEALNRLETNMINSFSDAVKLAKKINLPNLKVVADTYHFRMVNEPLEDILDAHDLLQHVHVGRTLGRTIPVPDDFENSVYLELAHVLKAAGYRGALSIEAAPSGDYKSELAASISMLRGYFG